MKYFDVELCKDKLNDRHQEIKSYYVEETRNYIRNIRYMILDHIDDVAEAMFEDAQHPTDKNQTMQPAQLKQNFLKMMESFESRYNVIMNDWSMGGLFKSYPNIQNDIDTAKQQRQQKIADKGDRLSNTLHESQRKKLRESVSYGINVHITPWLLGLSIILSLIPEESKTQIWDWIHALL